MPKSESKKSKWTAEEIKRFEDLAVLKNDDQQSLDARVRAANDLTNWVDELAFEHRIEGLVLIAQNAAPSTVKFEANAQLLRLTTEDPPEYVCTVIRGFRGSAQCARCGIELNEEEAHAVRDYPGLYCRSCCPGCAIVPRELLLEVDMDSALDEVGLDKGARPGREIVKMVRKDLSNISSGVN